MFNEFQITHEEHDYASQLHLRGELDVAAAAEVRNVVRELMGGGIRVMTVDLSATSFVDSTGLGVLLWAEHRLRAAGGELVVINAHGRVERTFELAGLDGLLLH